jgi:sugar (pentulose or hexulose) kinase
MKFVGIDIGSSSIKGAVLDLERLEVGPPRQVACPAPIAGKPTGHFETDPMAVLAAVAKVAEELNCGVQSFDGVVTCTQMGGVLLLDHRGNPVTNYLSWRDQRTVLRAPHQSECSYDRLLQRLTRQQLEELGRECKAGSALALLHWLSERQALPEGGIPVGIGDFVASKMAGVVGTTEPTCALGTLNLTTGDWHREAFDAAGLRGLEWPPLADVRQPLARADGSPGSSSIYPCIGDHQAALAGTLLEPGELSVNVSTGSQVSRIAETLEAGEFQVRPWFEGRFLNTVTHLPAGRSLNVLVDLLTELARAQGVELNDPWSDINRAVEQSAAGSRLAVDLAFFAGPLGDRGAIRDITVDNLTVGTLFRSAFESMAHNYRQISSRFAQPQPWVRQVLSGGLVHKCDLLRRLIVEQFSAPSRVCTETEETLTGLLIVALYVSGRCATFAEATRLVAEAR